ncbi:MAG: biopolymer transporter ExbD [Pseudomonadota bacterium]
MSGGGADPGAETSSSSSGFGGSVFGEAATPPVELNMTALMDILSNLLFFLLASFGTCVVMMIQATVPVQSKGKSDVEDKAQAVTVMVNISKTGFDVSVTGAVQTPQELEGLRRQIGASAASGEHDLQALHSHLVTIKERYKDSKTLIIVPEPGIPYGLMIKTMDAAREHETVAGGKRWVTKLLPEIVVSGTVK